VSDRTRPVAGCEEDPVGPVVEVLVGEGLEEVKRLLRVRIDAMRWLLTRPGNDHIRPVTLSKRFQILGIPCVIKGLNEIHIPFLFRHRCSFHFLIEVLESFRIAN
jgi:hypothetical protein